MKLRLFLKYLLFLSFLAFLIFTMVIIVKNIDNPQFIRMAAFAKNITSGFKNILRK